MPIASSPVLVTGITGFVASFVALNLLKKGYKVRGTVRSEKKAEDFKALPDFTKYVKDGSLTFAVVPDLVTGDFTESLVGVEHVHHVASPFNFSDEPEALLKPAILGTENVVNATIKAGTVKTLTLTSSMAAVFDLGDGFPKNFKTYTENDWNPATYEAAVGSGNSAFAYCASKALAEKKAYELIEKSGSGIKLASINPPAVFSTVIHHLEKLSDLNESNKAIWTILCDPKGLAQEFHDYVDTRDVAEAHVLAMEKGVTGRFIVNAGCFASQQLKDLVHEKYPQIAKELGTPVGQKGICGFNEEGIYRADNTKSIKELGLKYHSFEETFEPLVQQLYQFWKEGK